MKTLLFTYRKSLRTIVLLFSVLLLDPLSGTGQEYTKIQDGSYNVVKGAELTIRNKFGKINCLAWDESKVTIHVIVKVNASSQEKADRVLNKINVELSGTQTKVEGITTVGSISNSDFSIDYDIRMPRWMKLDLNNQFGDIYLDETEGDAKINLQYGELEARSFKGNSTEMSVKFSDAEIDYIKDGNINIEYSDWESENADNLRFYSRFSDLEAETSGKLVLDSQYDDVTINSAGEIILITRFTDAEIKKINGKFDFDSQYGELNVEYIAPGFVEGKVRNSFSDVNMTFDPKVNINVDAEMQFGELNYPKSASISHQTENYTTQVYKGKIGSGTTAGQLTIIGKNANARISFSE
ncbi:MAG TPA: hypothetical protein PLW31_11225 [Bacteroidales bacterium]|nr:hypothetical protein [Bacteroidales bacterium]HPI85582.1 hypothetical protein [Bacteroidales bacterium]HPM92034.1 hypothetical protein [Bacteroidales bacterium]